MIAGSIFPEKVYFDGNKCRTTRINEVIRLMLLTNSNDEGIENGQPFENFELSGEVELPGVEPGSKQET